MELSITSCIASVIVEKITWSTGLRGQGYASYWNLIESVPTVETNKIRLATAFRKKEGPGVRKIEKGD